MKKLLTLLFFGLVLTANSQTYMYIYEAHISPDSPITTDDEVSLQLIGDFSNTGSYVVDYFVSVDGFTVTFEINADSETGGATLVPFDLTYVLGTFAPGEYTVEFTGTGSSAIFEAPVTFIVEDDETGSISSTVGESEIHIYPNPSTDFVVINFEKWQNNMRVEMISADGKIAQNEVIVSKTTTLNTVGLEAGVYFVCILDPKGTALRTERVVVKD